MSETATESTAPIFPFTAIVGQREMKLALLLNAVDPGIGGVMIMGHRGTAKSTTVRALAALLPPVERGTLHAEIESQGQKTRVALFQNIPGGPVAVPFVDLPLGATEDRVVGTLDIEAVLRHGVKAFEPGLLAYAHGGFLYIDEVNLLEDHLVDLLLDVAASGVNVMEREGLSVRHPARFVLVGSGNPEEGDLRPQLLDRFGLHAQIATITDVQQRMQIVARTEAFRADPQKFHAQWAEKQQALRSKIARAREHLLPQVTISDTLLTRAVEVCIRLGIDGHRGEITIKRAACAYAALAGRTEVHAADIRAVAVLSLRHRLRRDPLEEMDSGLRVAAALDGLFPGTAEDEEVF